MVIIMLHSLEQTIQHKYLNEASGHDWYHIARVVHLSLSLTETNENIEYIKTLALLHEELDDKLNPSQSIEQLQSLLLTHHLPLEWLPQLITDIQSIGYKGGFFIPNRSNAAQYVSDADLLDAMGAIGIARTFQYNGQVKKAPFYDPTLADVHINNYHDYRHKKRNAIAHFDEKLLHLKSLIVSEKAKPLAEKRHQRLLQFVDAFFEELNEAGVDISNKFNY